MVKKLCITFDLDDTLIPTQEALYDVNKVEMARYIETVLEPTKVTEKTIKETFSKIDLENIPRYGFSRKRYPLSWVQTFVQLAGEEYPMLKCYKKEIDKLANWIFETPLQPFPIVENILKEARNSCDMMNILTAGDINVQEKRVRDAGLSHYFDNVVIVPTKNPTVMKNYLNDKNEYAHIMIGNSLRSDIYPALECGMVAIHVQSGSWDYDNYTVDTTNMNYFSAKLEDVPVILQDYGKDYG